MRRCERVGWLMGGWEGVRGTGVRAEVGGGGGGQGGKV